MRYASVTMARCDMTAWHTDDAISSYLLRVFDKEMLYIPVSQLQLIKDFDRLDLSVISSSVQW